MFYRLISFQWYVTNELRTIYWYRSPSINMLRFTNEIKNFPQKNLKITFFLLETNSLWRNFSLDPSFENVMQIWVCTKFQIQKCSTKKNQRILNEFFMWVPSKFDDSMENLWQTFQKEVNLRKVHEMFGSDLELSSLQLQYNEVLQQNIPSKVGGCVFEVIKSLI